MVKYLWYCDDELIIITDKMPSNPQIRVPKPTDTDEEKKDKKALPIYINKEFTFSIYYKGNAYAIPVKKGLCTDGSTIHRFFWTILGENPYSPNLLLGSIAHDIVTQNHSIVNNDRLLSTKIYRGMAISGGTPIWKATIIAACVDIYQFIARDWNVSIKGIVRKIIKKLSLK